jgi:hypothetical protein
VDGLENLSPFIAAYPEMRWNDVNAALRDAVSFSNSVRALPLDSDYVAVAYRQDVYDRWERVILPCQPRMVARHLQPCPAPCRQI